MRHRSGVPAAVFYGITGIGAAPVILVPAPRRYTGAGRSAVLAPRRKPGAGRHADMGAQSRLSPMNGVVMSSVRSAFIFSVLAAVWVLSACSATSANSDPMRQTTGTESVVPERFTAPADSIHAGGRISAADLPALRDAGIVHIIDLTPDAETPDFDEARAARAAGFAYDNLPIASPNDLNRETVATFDNLLRNRQGPTLVHCASGNRVGALAALRAAWVDGKSDEAVIAEGRRWGLRGLEAEVRQRLVQDRCSADAEGAENCAEGG